MFGAVTNASNVKHIKSIILLSCGRLLSFPIGRIFLGHQGDLPHGRHLTLCTQPCREWFPSGRGNGWRHTSPRRCPMARLLSNTGIRSFRDTAVPGRHGVGPFLRVFAKSHLSVNMLCRVVCLCVCLCVFGFVLFVCCCCFSGGGL